MRGLLEAFFANLAATIIGIGLGLPAAFYVNRRLTASQRHHQMASELERRNLAVEALSNACLYNSKVLNSMAEIALTAKVKLNPDLKTTTWDTLGPILSASCSDPALVDQLAHHWIRLRRLEQLNDEVFRRSTGILPTLEDSEMTVGMWQELHDSSSMLSSHATEFSERLMSIKSDP